MDHSNVYEQVPPSRKSEAQFSSDVKCGVFRPKVDNPFYKLLKSGENAKASPHHAGIDLGLR